MHKLPLSLCVGITFWKAMRPWYPPQSNGCWPDLKLKQLLPWLCHATIYKWLCQNMDILVLVSVSIGCHNMATPGPPSLEDIVRRVGVPHGEVEQECSDEHLRKISRFLHSWETLVPHLGLDVADEEEIKRNETEEKRRLVSLRKWKQKFAFNATYKALMEALLKIDRTDSAYEVCCLLKGIYFPNPSQLL